MNKITKLIPYGASALAFALTLSLALLLLPACTRENPVTPLGPEPEPEAEVDAGTGTPVVLTAIYSPETRTSYSNDAENNFSWDEGDEIAVLTTGDDVLTGTLTPSSSDPSRATVTLSGSGTRDKVAVYPKASYVAGSYEYENAQQCIFSVTLPDHYELSGKDDNWAPLPMAALNRESSTQLEFIHLCALARITCNNVPVGTKYIRISCPGRNLCGDMAIRINSSNGAKAYFLQEYKTYGDQVDFEIATSPLLVQRSGIVLNLPVISSYDGEYLYNESGALQATLLDENKVAISNYSFVALTAARFETSTGKGYQLTANFSL